MKTHRILINMVMDECTFLNFFPTAVQFPGIFFFVTGQNLNSYVSDTGSLLHLLL